MIRCRGLSQWYIQKELEPIRAVDEVDLQIPKGALAVITGPSGAGTTTLLCLLATLMRPTAGQIWLCDEEITHYSETALTRLRRERIGFIFQDFKLLPFTSLWRNVAYPLLPTGISESSARARALSSLGSMGLFDRAEHPPEKLSGGQQQRAAIARALIHNPELLFADEPTSNVDAEASEQLLDILQRLRHEGKTLVVASHDPAFLNVADEIHRMSNGRLCAEETR